MPSKKAPWKPYTPAQRRRCTEKERRRAQEQRKVLETLREKVQFLNPEKRTKLDVLRLAKQHIESLRRTLSEGTNENQAPDQPRKVQQPRTIWSDPLEKYLQPPISNKKNDEENESVQ